MVFSNGTSSVPSEREKESFSKTFVFGIAIDLLADHVIANVASGMRTDGRDFD